VRLLHLGSTPAASTNLRFPLRFKLRLAGQLVGKHINDFKDSEGCPPI